MSVIQLREMLLMLDPLLLNWSVLPKSMRFVVLGRMLILFKVTIVLSMRYFLFKIELFDLVDIYSLQEVNVRLRGCGA